MSQPLSINYETTVFTLRPDHFGANRATLLHARTTNRRSPFYTAILYIHGYSDYFFHDHVCQRFLEHGYDFYALDLRKCGRSIFSPEQDRYRHYCRDLHEYDEEITLAIEHMIKQSDPSQQQRKLILLGHSTGGLLVTMYASSGPRHGDIDAVILNSPYLAPVETNLAESALLNMVILLNISKDNEDLWYGRSLHVSHRGEWNFDPKKKSIEAIRLHGAFFGAIRAAHHDLQKNRFTVQCPVLFMTSDRSLRAEKTWRDEYAEVDLILNVTTMKQAARFIGPRVTMCEIANAKHDILLSKATVREKAFETIFDWLQHLEDDWTAAAAKKA